MNIAILAHEKKKELMVQFCIAYKGILVKHNLIATGTTGGLIIDATGQYPTSSSGADLYVDYIRFAYNSTLTGIKVNGKAAKPESDTTFTYTIDSDLMPSLEFIGEVSDQAQKIVWSEAVEMGYNVRTAMITNFAEDGTSTNYTLKLKRQLDSNSDLKGIVIDGDTLSNFDSNTKDYTIQIASKRTSLLDIQPSLMQSIMYRAMPT